jgi:hypothetical protein
MRRKFRSIHWSQLQPGDVVQMTRTIWTKVERVEHHDDFTLMVWGEDTTGSRKGAATSRTLSRRGIDDLGVLLIENRP